MRDGFSIHDKVKRFVQETLGCGCPEEVFCTIERWNNVCPPDTEVRLISRIGIGGRLLIYMMEPPADDDTFRSVITAGLRERDERGFNRLRIVLVKEDREGEPEDLTGTSGAGAVFASLAPDDRIHLHEVYREEIP